MAVSGRNSGLHLATSPGPSNKGQPTIIAIAANYGSGPTRISTTVGIARNPPSLVLRCAIPTNNGVVLPLSNTVSYAISCNSKCDRGLTLALGPTANDLVGCRCTRTNICRISMSNSIRRLCDLRKRSRASHDCLATIGR